MNINNTCPYCGGKAELRTKKIKKFISRKELQGQRIALYYLRCKTCRAKTNLFHDIAIAFHEWNLGHIYKNGFIRDLES